VAGGELLHFGAADDEMPELCVGDEDAIAIHGGSDTGAER
jgi:hypothetical protein